MNKQILLPTLHWCLDFRQVFGLKTRVIVKISTHKLFFSSPWKLVNIYRLARMGQNFEHLHKHMQTVQIYFYISVSWLCAKVQKYKRAKYVSWALHISSKEVTSELRTFLITPSNINHGGLELYLHLWTIYVYKPPFWAFFFTFYLFFIQIL